MRRFFFLLLLLHFPVFAAQLLVCPNLNAPMQQRLAWVFQTADPKSFWIGYSITRFADPEQTFISNVSFHGRIAFDDYKPSLRDWIDGTKTRRQTAEAAAQSELDRLQHKKREKIWKDIAIFQKFRKGSPTPDTTCAIDMSMHYAFDEPLYWIGSVSHEESFDYLLKQYGHLSLERKQQWIGAISIHPSALVFPFLKRLLTTNEPEDVQSSAAIFLGEVDDPAALPLLQNVALTNLSKEVRQSAIAGIADNDSEESIKLLIEFAISSPDPESRQTAMAMLADKEDPQALRTLERIAWFDPDSDMRQDAIAMMSESEKAVPILLKIMDDHPSKETREAALRMLAETVAGRKVLKQKLKE